MEKLVNMFEDDDISESELIQWKKKVSWPFHTHSDSQLIWAYKQLGCLAIYLNCVFKWLIIDHLLFIDARRNWIVVY